jgi:steroid delta-isomerase-like uncharacterized protein
MKTKKIVDLYKDDFWSQGKLELKDELLTPDFSFTSPAQAVDGSEAVAGYLSYLRSVFPDLHFETHDTIIEGDRVASIWTLYGTQEQEFMGFPAQGQKVALPGVSIMNISEGRLSQERVYWDRLTLLEQLQLSTEPA